MMGGCGLCGRGRLGIVGGAVVIRSLRLTCLSTILSVTATHLVYE